MENKVVNTSWICDGLKKHQKTEYDFVEAMMERAYSKFALNDEFVFVHFASSNSIYYNTAYNKFKRLGSKGFEVFRVPYNMVGMLAHVCSTLENIDGYLDEFNSFWASKAQEEEQGQEQEEIKNEHIEIYVDNAESLGPKEDDAFQSGYIITLNYSSNKLKNGFKGIVGYVLSVILNNQYCDYYRKMIGKDGQSYDDIQNIILNADVKNVDNAFNEDNGSNAVMDSSTDDVIANKMIYILRHHDEYSDDIVEAAKLYDAEKSFNVAFTAYLTIKLLEASDDANIDRMVLRLNSTIMPMPDIRNFLELETWRFELMNILLTFGTSGNNKVLENQKEFISKKESYEGIQNCALKMCDKVFYNKDYITHEEFKEFIDKMEALRKGKGVKKERNVSAVISNDAIASLGFNVLNAVDENKLSINSITNTPFKLK